MRISTAADLGALVRQARLDKGMTQSDLAEKIGTSRQWVAQLESGAPNIRLELVLGALRALELRVDVGPEQTRARSLPATERASRAALDSLSATGALTRPLSAASILRDQRPLTLSQAGFRDSLQPVRDTARQAALAHFGLGGDFFDKLFPPASALAGILGDQAIRLAQIERSSAGATGGVESRTDADEDGR